MYAKIRTSLVLFCLCILGALLACPGPEIVDDASVFDAGKDATTTDLAVQDRFRQDSFVPDANHDDAARDDARHDDSESADLSRPDARVNDVESPDQVSADVATVDSTSPDKVLVDTGVNDVSSTDNYVDDVENIDSERADTLTADTNAADGAVADTASTDASSSDQFVNDSTVADSFSDDAADASSSCDYPNIVAGDTCRAVRVLVLDDGASPNSGVVAALTGAGFTVTDGGLYYQWDGLTPSLDNIDTVFILQGTDYDNELLPAANTLLTAFVANGGGLVRTEWVAWVGTENTVNAMLPVDSSLSFDYEPNWHINDVDHPLARNITEGFIANSGYTLTTLRAQATAVIEDEYGYPIASFTRLHGGTVVHLNHDVTGSYEPIDDMALTLYKNAAFFAALR